MVLPQFKRCRILCPGFVQRKGERPGRLETPAANLNRVYAEQVRRRPSRLLPGFAVATNFTGRATGSPDIVRSEDAFDSRDDQVVIIRQLGQLLDEFHKVCLDQRGFGLAQVLSRYSLLFHRLILPAFLGC